ncbi:DUF5947 family protein [Saccharopolyspora shandongensis]|uniref:DUF5947 family protein n=1 Tax=Saccharopolyspora shandongensis TaxID=418495 RepID=UPI0033EDAF00
MRSAALERLARQVRRRAEGQPCDVCGAPVPDEHRHVLDLGRRELMCACRACAVLFDRDAAGGDHLRLVPQRRQRLEPVPTADLGVPVGLAFFTIQSDGAVVAHYPSPAGAAEWEVDPHIWQEVVDRHAQLGTMAREVEALLVNTARGQREHWIVPVEDCFRLIAVVRREWSGLSGGSTVWPAIEQFFAALAEDGRSCNG